DPGEIRKHRLMLGKTDIDHIPAVGHRLPGKRPGEITEFFNIGHLPYNIVSQTDIVQDFIHLRKAAVYLIKCCHKQPPFIFPYENVKKQDKEALSGTSLSCLYSYYSIS